MTRAQLTTMLDLAAAGHGPAAIGREIGAHPEAVRGALRARGIRVQRKPAALPVQRASNSTARPWTDADDCRLIEMFAAARTDSEIARALGRSRSDVRVRRGVLRLWRPGTRRVRAA